MTYRWIINEETEQSERELLATLCKHPECFTDIAEIVGPEEFGTEIYKEMFSIAEELDNDAQLTMAKLLYRTKQKGLLEQFENPNEFTQRIMKTSISPELWSDYAEKVLNLSQRRAAEKTAQEIYDFSQSNDFTIDGVMKIASGMETLERSKEENKDDFWLDYYERKMSGVIDETPPIGFPKIDGWMKGIGRNRLIVVAGRPGTGKTALALHILRHIAQQEKFGVPLMFSMEMVKDELYDRMISNAAGINALRLTRNELTDEEKARIHGPISKIRNLNMVIDDNSNVTLGYIKRKAKAAKKKYGQLSCIIIDYLGLLNMQRKAYETAAEAIERTTRELKLFAKKIGCSIILLAQLNRENEKTERRPKSSDLRGSGSIEQDADMIILLHHDAESDPDELTNRVEFIVSKGRQTGTGTFYLDFIKPIQRMSEVFQ